MYHMYFKAYSFICIYTTVVVFLSLVWRQCVHYIQAIQFISDHICIILCSILHHTCCACAATLSLAFLLAADSLSFLQRSRRVDIRWPIVLEERCPPDFSLAPSLQTVSKCGSCPECHKQYLINECTNNLFNVQTHLVPEQSVLTKWGVLISGIAHKQGTWDSQKCLFYWSIPISEYFDFHGLHFASFPYQSQHTCIR